MVSRFAKKLGFRVLSNDWEPYSEQIAMGTVVLNEIPKFENLGGVEKVFDILNNVVPVENYVTKHLCPTNDDNLDHDKDRLFFMRKNGMKIDAMRELISEWVGKFSSNYNDNSPSRTIIQNGNNENMREVFDDLGREEKTGWGYFLLHQGYTVWWIVTSLGLIFAILLLVWSAQDADFALEISYNPLTLDGFITWIGLIGTSLSIILYISQKNWISDDSEASIGDKLYSMRGEIHCSFRRRWNL